jgi:hypothetical protein
MKVKHSIIPFIPIALAMLGLKLMTIFGVDSDGLFLGMTKMNITYIVIALALAVFLITVVFNLFDRKTAQVYAVKRNPVAGVLGLISGFAVAAASLYSVVEVLPDSDYYIMTLISAAFSVPAAIALILMAKVHFVGRATSSGISFLFVFPSLWGCAELVNEFLGATKLSISSSDLTALFCYIFITLYFFSLSMILSRVKGKNPVKACFIYGLPAAAVSITYGVYDIITAVMEKSGLSQILVGVSLVVIGVYALSFVIELAFNTLTKDEVEIIEGMPDEDDPKEETYTSPVGYDDLVFSEAPSSNELKGDDTSDYISSVESLNDFVIGYDNDENEEPIPYFTKEEMQKSTDLNNMFVTSNGVDNEPLIKQNVEPEKPAEEKPVEPKAEAKPEPKTEPKVEAKPEPKPEPKAEPKAEQPAKKQEPAKAEKVEIQADAPAAKEPSAPKTNKDDELELILSEARIYRSSEQSAPVQPAKQAPKAEPAPQKQKDEKQLSDVDLLLQELDNMS